MEIHTLETKLKRELKTVKQSALAVAHLGGHMNRKADGMPGWITLWRGMKTLQLLKERVAFRLMYRVLGNDKVETGGHSPAPIRNYHRIVFSGSN